MMLRTKITVGFVLIQAVLLSILILTSLDTLQRSNEEQLLKRTATTTTLFSAIAKDAVIATDLGALKSVVDELMTQPEIVYARIKNESATVLAQGMVKTPKADSDKVLHAVADITVTGHKYGTVEVGYSKASITHLIEAARQRTITIAIVNMLLVAVFAVMLGIYLTRGLDGLRVATERVARGEFGYQVQTRGKDEIAQTAHAFNSMSLKLSDMHSEQVRATEEIKNLNHDLEDRVNQRTRQLTSLNEELEHQSFHDALTKIPNRVLFRDRLQQAVLMGRRDKSSFAVFAIDLDRFKAINDTLGHHVGDIVLQEVAERMQAILRESDTVARMGGDEFSLLLPRVADADAAAIVAQKIVDAVVKSIVIGGHTLDVGASIGIALAPQHGDSGETLMRHADAAMYEAKQTRGGYIFFRDDLEQVAQERNLQLAELRDALANDQMVLHYQPKIDFATNLISGVEALVRWQHPTRGLVFPDDFIPLAEKSGLIKILTVVVLQKALAQCVSWRRTGINLTMAVNASAINLQDEGFPLRVSEILKEQGAEASWLELEVTESAIMTNPVLAIANIKALSEMGAQISIDDFGTGYSSMTYLKKLLVAKIKIDKSFVMEMSTDKSDAVIVRSTIDLGHNLGLTVIAEGVENAETWAELKKLGCDAAQGYYMSRPLPAEKFSDWLSNSLWSGQVKVPPVG